MISFNLLRIVLPNVNAERRGQGHPDLIGDEWDGRLVVDVAKGLHGHPNQHPQDAAIHSGLRLKNNINIIDILLYRNCMNALLAIVFVWIYKSIEIKY